MKWIGVVTTAVLFSLLGAAAPAYAQQGEHGNRQDRTDQQNQTDKQQGKPEQDQQQKDKDKQRQAQQQQDQNKQREAQQQGRLSQERQRQLIAQQQQRSTQYRQYMGQQQHLEQPRTALLQQQKRTAQFRVEQEYGERWRQQQMHIENEHHDYDRDPYYYTAPNYRYFRGGHYYETNQYGIDLLRQAVNYGYAEGFRAGEADRQDRWPFNYQDAYAFQDANYGYNGYYVEQEDYNYYFREGFRRGYEDGYNSRYQYGRYSDGNYSVLGDTLSLILKFELLH